MIDDVIYYKDRIYLVLGSKLKERVMHASHKLPLVGHPSYMKTYRSICEIFSWKGLKEDVLRHVRECLTCQ